MLLICLENYTENKTQTLYCDFKICIIWPMPASVTSSSKQMILQGQLEVPRALLEDQ